MCFKVPKIKIPGAGETGKQSRTHIVRFPAPIAGALQPLVISAPVRSDIADLWKGHLYSDAHTTGDPAPDTYT